ncbi:MAG TPA: nicotinate-nucleotide diphosphorylase (carboxylating), partial [Alphaproteobacteria bacterium]|nr:nicotinate-nucleotide diphosphorylase (carboxylating) [Alphaproteobacteria bacterium]
MTAIAPLPNLLIEPLVRMALAEDFGRAGDITSQSCIAAGTHAVADIVARRPGRLAGLDLAALAFRLVDPAVAFTVHRPDGSDLEPGTAVATIAGPARALLSAERVALNFLTHLSGIATATARMVRAVAGSGARIACTRKTTPGLRLVE